MSLGTRIKERREQLGLTRIELADKIGVTPSAIANYENGISSPKIELMYRLFDALDCDANYLHQDDMKKIAYQNSITLDEFERLIKPYRELDIQGQQHVDTVLEWETKRISDMNLLKAQAAEKASKVVSIENAAEKKYYITYYQKLASAGSGEYLFSDIPTELIAVADTPMARKADFVIGVNGDSMDPDFRDGDRVFVQKMAEIPTGSIGIFVRGNECFIKELGNDRLISHNKEYGDIPANEDIRCVGLVLGKV